MQTTAITTCIQFAAAAAALALAECACGAQTPSIQSFSPSSGPVGTVVTIDGANFDRDRTGAVWAGATPPYRVAFAQSGGLAQITPTFVSPTRIRAVVPAGAVTAPLRIQQGFTILSTSAAAFTVTAGNGASVSSAGVLRIVNNTQYNLVDLRINGSHALPVGVQIPPGSFGHVNLTAGSVNVAAGVGFLTAGGGRDVWFQFQRTALMQAGQTTTVTLNRITVGRLLTIGANGANWDGQFFDGNGVPHLARFHFTSSGSWVFSVDGVQHGTGIVSEVSWPISSSIVQFQVSSTVPTISIAHPFGSFLCKNGPPSFPVIQYVRQ